MISLYINVYNRVTETCYTYELYTAHAKESINFPQNCTFVLLWYSYHSLAFFIRNTSIYYIFIDNACRKHRKHIYIIIRIYPDTEQTELDN